MYRVSRRRSRATSQKPLCYQEYSRAQGEGMIGRNWSAGGTILLIGKDVISAPAKPAKTFFSVFLEQAFKKTNLFDQLVDVARFLDRPLVFMYC
jgi:hypothetical protein